MRLTKRNHEENEARKWQRKIINWHPAKVNELMSGHWSKRQKLKKADRDIISHYMALIPEATCKRRVELFIGLGYRQRGGDPDAYFKSLLDALVQAEMLIDDNKEGVELAPVQYYRTERDAETMIIITDIEDEPRKKQVGW